MTCKDCIYLEECDKDKKICEDFYPKRLKEFEVAFKYEYYICKFCNKVTKERYTCRYCGRDPIEDTDE